MDVDPEKCLPCPSGAYAAPLLKHGCAELASAQHTIPTKRVFHQLMVVERSRSCGSIPKNRRRRIFIPVVGATQQHGCRSRKIAAGVFFFPVIGGAQQ
ncbi:MAG: hypothetical protein ACYCYO_22365 [Bacilli bacterium]